MRFILAFLALIATSAYGQNTVLQGGPNAKLHAPMYTPNAGSSPVIQDSGPAGGGSVNYGLSEELLLQRSNTGVYPAVSTGTGPYYTNLCDYDAPINNPTGYHYLCFGPNNAGNGILAYGNGGGATPGKLMWYVNGIAYQFPFSVGGIVGPPSSIVNDVACWNNTVGTLLKDCGTFPVTAVGANPTAQVGNTVINGTATTFMRSDAAPPLAAGAALGNIGPGGITNTYLANPSMTFGAQNVTLGGSAAVQGNAGKIQLGTGSFTSGDCAQYDANGNLIDSGGACGGGGSSCTAAKANCVGWYNVVFYGADPTGATFSDTAVASAVTAAGSTGVIYFPKGTYKLSTAIALTAGSRQVVKGDGPGATVIYQTSTTANGITVANTSLVNFGGGVEGVALTTDLTNSCSSSIGSTGSGIDIHFAGDSFYINNVLLYGFANNLRYRDSWNTFNTNIQDLCYKNTGIELDYNTGANPSGTGFFGNINLGTKATGAVGTVGIFIGADAGSYWENIQEGAADTGIVLRPKPQSGGGNGIGAQFFSTVLADANLSNGWLFDTQTNSGSQMQSIFCENCWAGFNHNVGVVSQGAAGSITGVEFSGGQVSQNAFQGMLITSAMKNVVLSGGLHVIDNSNPVTGGSANTNPGIEIGASTGSVTIGSVFSGNSGSGFGGTVQEASVLIDSGATNVLVTGNDFSTYQGASAIVNNATASTVLICNNIGSALNVNCTSGSGSGTVNSCANANYLAYYAGAGTTVSCTNAPNVSTLTASASVQTPAILNTSGHQYLSEASDTGTVFIGNATTTEAVTAIGHFLPNAASTYNLGAVSFPWLNAYIGTAVIGSSATIGGNNVLYGTSITSGQCSQFIGSFGAVAASGAPCGTITNVTAGNQMTGGGSSGSVTVGVSTTPSFTSVQTPQILNTSGHPILAESSDSGAVFIGNETTTNFVTSVGTFLPNGDNTYHMGATGQRWIDVWAVNGTIQTSDARKKTDKGASLGLEFIDCLEPASYVWREGDDKRIHQGLYAQQVQSCLHGRDFAGLHVPDSEQDSYGLVYAEFTGPLIAAVQIIDDKINVGYVIIVILLGWNVMLTLRVSKLEKKK